MKYIYILEDDPKLLKQIYEALRKSDLQAQIRYFSSFEDFKNWIPLAIKLGKEAISQGGQKYLADPNPMMPFKEDDEVSLFITKDEWLGSRYMPLVKKTHELFIRKGLCSKEEPTRVVLTAFESPTFDIKLVEERIINNVIFKPFDELILQEHLNVALSGRRPAMKSFVHKVQTEQEVEMTKEVRMEAVGDVGFVTRSPREIPLGGVAKYYGDVFKGVGRIHALARCLACQPHPDFKDEYRVWFSYFGIPSRQVSDIRQSMVKRNEVEYSANWPATVAAVKKKWHIVDPHRDRAIKFKKILEVLLEAQVEVSVGLDAFIFQTDPMGKDLGRREKHWDDFPTVKFNFDIKGEKIISIEPEEATYNRLLGMTFAELKSKDFTSRLHPVSVDPWKRAITQNLNQPQIFLFQSGSLYFPLELRSLQKKDDQCLVEFAVPDEASRFQWFQKNFPNPALDQGILIAEEYLKDDRLEFWNDFRSKATQMKFFGLYEKAPNEKVARERHWLDDLFEESNDTHYVKRKLSWLLGLPLVDNEMPPYLNSCQEIIRVANPVEIAELSEGGLIMNYYRAISPGSFRQFVLATTSDSFIEYLATCNYTSEHPTDKEIFQNHFIFFGITDVFLKSIRLWILENHVQSKQQEGA